MAWTAWPAAWRCAPCSPTCAAYAVSGACAIGIAFATDHVVALILVALSVVGFVSLRRLGYFHAQAGMLQLRRRNLGMRSAVQEIADSLRHACSVDDVLDSAKAFAAVVSADRMRVDLRSAQVESIRRSAVLRGPSLLPMNGHVNDVPLLLANDAPNPFLVRFELPDALGRVELEWHDGRDNVDRDHELAAEILCGHIAQALRRVTPPPAPRRLFAPIWAPIEPLVSSLSNARNRLRRDHDA